MNVDPDVIDSVGMKEVRRRWLKALYKQQMVKTETIAVDDEYMPEEDHPSDMPVDEPMGNADVVDAGSEADSASQLHVGDGESTMMEAISEGVREEIVDFELEEELDLFNTANLLSEEAEALSDTLRENLDILLKSASSNDKVLMASKISSKVGMQKLQSMEAEMSLADFKPCNLSPEQRQQICMHMSQLTCEFDQETRFVDHWHDVRKKYSAIELPLPMRVSEKFSHETLQAHINQAFFRPTSGGDMQHWYPAIMQSDFDIRTSPIAANYREECYQFYKGWAECAYETTFEEARLALNCDGKQSDGFIGFGLTPEFVAIAMNCRMPPFCLAECSKQFGRCPGSGCKKIVIKGTGNCALCGTYISDACELDLIQGVSQVAINMIGKMHDDPTGLTAEGEEERIFDMNVVTDAMKAEDARNGIIVNDKKTPIKYSRVYASLVQQGTMDDAAFEDAKLVERKRYERAKHAGFLNVKDRLERDPIFFWQMYVQSEMQQHFERAKSELKLDYAMMPTFMDVKLLAKQKPHLVTQSMALYKRRFGTYDVGEKLKQFLSIATSVAAASSLPIANAQASDGVHTPEEVKDMLAAAAVAMNLDLVFVVKVLIALIVVMLIFAVAAYCYHKREVKRLSLALRQHAPATNAEEDSSEEEPEAPPPLNPTVLTDPTDALELRPEQVLFRKQLAMLYQTAYSNLFHVKRDCRGLRNETTCDRIYICKYCLESDDGYVSQKEFADRNCSIVVGRPAATRSVLTDRTIVVDQRPDRRFYSNQRANPEVLRALSSEERRRQNEQASSSTDNPIIFRHIR